MVVGGVVGVRVQEPVKDCVGDAVPEAEAGDGVGSDGVTVEGLKVGVGLWGLQLRENVALREGERVMDVPVRVSVS